MGSGYDLSSANHIHSRLEFITELIVREAGYVALFGLVQIEQKGCGPSIGTDLAKAAS